MCASTRPTVVTQSRLCLVGTPCHVCPHDEAGSPIPSYPSIHLRLQYLIKYIVNKCMASRYNIELGPRHDNPRLDGYPSLSHFIAQDSDAEIYRRFTRLGARNLLHLQSIVINLERKLDELDKHDAENAAGNPEIRKAARRLPREEAGDEKERVLLREQIAVALKEYSKVVSMVTRRAD